MPYLQPPAFATMSDMPPERRSPGSPDAPHTSRSAAPAPENADIPDTSDSSAASPLQALRDLQSNVSGAAARAVAAILDSPGRAARSSITEMAGYCDVSPATLSRLAATLGYDGFVAMRAAIATEHGREIQGGWQRDIGTKIAPDDDPAKVLSVLIASQNRAMRNASAAIDLDAAHRVADWLAAAGRIQLYGDWGDSVSVYELYLRLLRIGRPVWFQDSRQGSKVTAGLLGPGDVMVCLTRSGNDEVAREVSEIARAGGAHTVIITGDPTTELAKMVDVALFTGTRLGASWTDYFGGRASDHLTASLLWLLVAQRVPDALGLSYGPSEPETAQSPAAPPHKPTDTRDPNRRSPHTGTAED